MRRDLVPLLCCPQCHGDLALAEVREENPIRVLRGALICSGCQRRYPVEAGIPRLVVAAGDVKEIGRRFEYQWVSRLRGRFEGGERCYGFGHREYAGWVSDQLARERPLLAGERILDAGSGSGEKTNVLAALHPAQHVVGMDLALGALEGAAARFGNTPNLDFVQGNVLAPPFKPAIFAWGVSIGVLHHTPSTRRALASFRSLLTADAGVLIWIYPTYREGPEWQFLYFARDVMLAGQGPELPPDLLRALSYLLVVGFLPLALVSWQKHGQRIQQALPFFDTERMSLRQRFDALVFHTFDTLHPRYQFRHPRAEVERWFGEEGLRLVFAAHGYYVARGRH